MADEQLFEDLPEQARPQAEGRGALRLRVPERRQIGLHVAALDDLVSNDHPVRAVWEFVEGLDLSELHDAIKAREGQPGHPPAAPELMLALWLWATVDGVGSARQLDRLCRDHLVYRWLCGGVSMNYHSLSSFRIAHMAVLERLLAQGVASMVEAGLVSLDTLAQDGWPRVPGRVRSAGARGLMSCMRRRGRGWSACGRKSRRIRRRAIGVSAPPRIAAPASVWSGSRRRRRA